MKIANLSAGFVISIFLILSFAPQVAALQQEKETIKVVAEDELAPVRAIREGIRKRLGQAAGSLDLDLIMEGSDFYGTSPRSVRWDSDGGRLWFEWKRWDEEESGTYEYTLADSELKRLSEDEAERVPSARAVWDRERQRAMWGVRDDIWIYDGRNKELRLLIEGLRGARPVAFSGDGSTAVLFYANNLVAVTLGASGESPVFAQLTDIRSGSPPKEDPPTEGRKWQRAQQLALFDVLNRRDKKRKEEKEREEGLEPKPVYLQGWRVSRLAPSPDLKHVAMFLSREASGARTTKVPDYVTASGYTEEISTRTKVGDAVGSSRLGIIEVSSGRVGYPEYGLEDREIRSWPILSWSPDSSKAITFLGSVDNKDAWLVSLEPKAGEKADSLEVATTLVASDHDDAWINRRIARGIGWLPDGSGAYFVSERSGRMHLYSVSAGGGDATALTEGDYIVYSPRLTTDRSGFVFEASIPGPFELQAYFLPLAGGQPQQLTSGFGRADVRLSPDGRRLAIVGSQSNSPEELYVKEVDESGIGVKVTDSPSPAFKSRSWIEPEIVRFPAEDGALVPARLYLPENPHPSHPAVIFVHGAGYMQNVHRWWSGYGREYCFHHLLIGLGYTVLDIDYRGSAGYGRDWRTGIYRHMGGKDLSDQVDGARYLVREHGIDPGRIGIYGGSYGGFITLMALFTASDHFAAGAALRPVTDWAAYSHYYTGNILNTPSKDPEAYLRSSPIYFAEGLEDPLLICHGMVDTNVHFQGVARLAQRLIELRKRNWEVAFYPVEGHGFREPSSWADEYWRILQLFEENLKD